MRAVLQRVSRASVTIEKKETRSIGKGFVILLGIAPEDTEDDLEWLAGKISRMRIFEDSEGKMNLGLSDIGGQVLVVSQFTLFASTKKGNRPSFNASAPPEKAIPLYRKFYHRLGDLCGSPSVTGEFGASMEVELVNDGPVTILMDSQNRE